MIFFIALVLAVFTGLAFGWGWAIVVFAVLLLGGVALLVWADQPSYGYSRRAPRKVRKARKARAKATREDRARKAAREAEARARAAHPSSQQRP